MVSPHSKSYWNNASTTHILLFPQPGGGGGGLTADLHFHPVHYWKSLCCLGCRPSPARNTSPTPAQKTTMTPVMGSRLPNRKHGKHEGGGGTPQSCGRPGRSPTPYSCVTVTLFSPSMNGDPNTAAAQTVGGITRERVLYTCKRHDLNEV